MNDGKNSDALLGKLASECEHWKRRAMIAEPLNEKWRCAANKTETDNAALRTEIVELRSRLRSYLGSESVSPFPATALSKQLRSEAGRPEGIENGTALVAAQMVEHLEARVLSLEILLKESQADSFLAAVNAEAAHQIERWGAAGGKGKTPLDWYWLISHFAQKAADAAIAGDRGKALRDVVSTAAVLFNWFGAIKGTEARFQALVDELAPPKLAAE
ncbi:hypothetical protein [Methylocapsa aurea]|uniref:hypothetical protein n=1 Tax=Methylocapsa aurea TaxID=663610 RepID=UPI0005646751|nr:hypothetical protein [Methylocapsa aurea]